MAIDVRKQITKQPGEKIPFDLDFGREIPPGADKILSGTASAVKWPRKDPTNKSNATGEILLSTVPVVVGVSKTRLRIMVVSGTDGFEYQITVHALWDNGADLEEEVYVRVREE